jgi:lysyl-tRNA synthetase class II
MNLALYDILESDIEVRLPTEHEPATELWINEVELAALYEVPNHSDRDEHEPSLTRPGVTDPEFITGCRAGMWPAVGFAIGIDRLAAIVSRTGVSEVPTYGWRQHS